MYAYIVSAVFITFAAFCAYVCRYFQMQKGKVARTLVILCKVSFAIALIDALIVIGTGVAEKLSIFF